MRFYMYEQESVIRTDCGETEWFNIIRDVRQGCLLSPGLINLYPEVIMREAIKPGGRVISGTHMTPH